MNFPTRGKTLLAGGAAFASAIALSAYALASAAGAATAQSTDYVPSCNQNVPVGQFTCFAERRTDVHEAKVLSPNATPDGYGPSEIQSAYDLPAASGSPTVAIVDAYDYPSAASDLATYRSQFGLPACTTANGCFEKVNQEGQTSPLPTGDQGWSQEESLDLDAVSDACPACHIILVEADDASDNLFTAVNTAYSLGARFISMSWGGSEDGSESSYDSQYFNHTGVVYTASTGDDGYSAGVIYPSTSPNIVSAGGTTLEQGGGSRGWTETAWSDGGSGCSQDEAKPSWQSSISACSTRGDADLSADADPNTGLAIYNTYGDSGWDVYGGTSLSAPLLAAMYAIAGTPGSGDHPNSYPYADTAGLNDITSGSNGSCSPSTLCKAGTGWDGPTGLGSPNGVAALTANGGGGGGGGGGNPPPPPSSVTVTNPGSQSGTVGTAVSLRLSASGGTAPYTWSATGLPAGLSISSAGVISGTPTTAANSTVTVTATDSTGATGSASFSFAISSSGGGGGGGGGGGSCSGQILANPGFESGSADWTATSGVINTDGEYSHSGNGYAWLDGYGTTHTDTLSQSSVTIPSGCTATLSYYLWVSSEDVTNHAYDTLTLTVNGQTVQTFSNENQGNGYVKRSVNLSSFAGQTVTLKWTGSEDEIYATSFVIDDTALNLS